MKGTYLTVVVVLLLGVALLPVGTAAADTSATTAQFDETPEDPADENEDDDEEDDDGDTTIINIDLDPIEDAIDDLSDDLIDKIKNAIFGPFEALAEALVTLLTHLFTSYPQVHPNEDVQELHRLSLIVTFALSTLTLIVAGILFQIGPLFGISYQQVRMILPRVLLALVFSTVSPFLLQYAVDLAEALTLAFKPDNPGFLGTVQLTGGLVLIAVLDAFLLAAVAAIFVVRDVYILFAAAASPLIALGWALPYSRRFANSFIGAFWGFLLIGPLDMIVFRLILSLLQPNGVELPHWLLAMGGFAMLLGVPYMVLSTGQAMAGALAGVFNGVRTTQMPDRSLGRERTYQERLQQRRHHEQDAIRRFAESDSRRRRRNSPDTYYSSGGINRRTQPSNQRDNKFREYLPEDYDQ